MSGKLLVRALAGASLLSLVAVAPAGAQNQTFLDLQAGVGYSTNPDLRRDGVGSGYGRISAYGFHSWNSERTQTSLSGYVENTAYLRRLGNRQAFSVNAATSTKASENLSLFGSLGVSGDFGAQLSSRFFGAPADTIVADPLFPPTSVIVVTPDLVALSQRQYRLSAAGGGSYVLSPRDSLTGTFGAQRIWFTGGGVGPLAVRDYNQYDASLAWRHRVNERLSAGVRLLASRADYTLGRSVTTYGPQLTADLSLSENLQLGGGIGFVRTERGGNGAGLDSSSTDLAFDASLCRSLEYESFCARIARRSQSVALGSAPSSSSFVADYSRRLSARDQLQASAQFVTTGASREIALGRQNFYSVSGAYDRKISTRLSAGVNLIARKFTVGGPDPDADIGGSIYLRNRFGSIR